MVRKVWGVYDAVDTEFIVDVIRSTWFTRTWTVQEVALARHSTLVCGNKTLDWRSFLNTLRVLQRALNDLAATALEVNIRPVFNPATFFDDLKTHDTMAIMVSLEETFSLAQAFDMIRQNRSSDPKDKVYGLFGILDYLNIDDLPAVDYTRSMQ